MWQISFTKEITKLAAKEQNKPPKKQHAASDMLAGGAAGIAAMYSTYPIDTVSQFQQMHPGRSMGNIVKSLSRKGIKGFYGGMGTKTLKAGLYGGISFGAYEGLKKLLHGKDNDS